jgi:hypothetical protein
MKKVVLEKFMNWVVRMKFPITKFCVFKFDVTSLKVVYPIATRILHIERNTLLHDAIPYIPYEGTG